MKDEFRVSNGEGGGIAYSVVSEMTIVNVVVEHLKEALSILLVVLPVAHIGTHHALAVGLGSMTMIHVLLPLTLVFNP